MEMLSVLVLDAEMALSGRLTHHLCGMTGWVRNWVSRELEGQPEAEPNNHELGPSASRAHLWARCTPKVSRLQELGAKFTWMSLRRPEQRNSRNTSTPFIRGVSRNGQYVCFLRGLRPQVRQESLEQAVFGGL